MVRAMGVSSLPEASATATVGASATAVMVTAMMSLVVAVSPLAFSVLVAATVSVKLTSLCSTGVIERLLRFQEAISMDVLPEVAVKLLVPSVRVAPTGIAPTSSELSASEPSTSTRVAPIAREIGVSSLPEASATARVGASATAVMLTSMVSLVVAVSPLAFSLLVAATVRVKLASLCSTGVIDRLLRFQEAMSIEVFPEVAVKLLVPSVMVAPTGIAPTSRELIVSEPSASTRAAPIV